MYMGPKGSTGARSVPKSRTGPGPEPINVPITLLWIILGFCPHNEIERVGLRQKPALVQLTK